MASCRGRRTCGFLLLRWSVLVPLLLQVEASSGSAAQGRQLQQLYADAYQFPFVDPTIDPTAGDPVVPASGSWKLVGNSGVVAIHAHLFPNSKVLFVDRPLNLSQDSFENQPPGGHWRTASLFDLATNNATLVYIKFASYCGSYSQLPDGNLIMAGGDTPVNTTLGLSDAHKAIQLMLWNGTLGTTEVATMAKGRWYPSTIALPNGAILIVGGSQEYTPPYGQIVTTPNNPSYQMWYPNATSGGYYLTAVANMNFLNTDYPNSIYPLLFLLPKTGKVMVIGGHASYIFSISGTTLTQSNLAADTIPSLPVNPLYPQTASGLQLELTAANNYTTTIAIIGGTTVDNPNGTANATNIIKVLVLDGINKPSWQSIQMPIPRVMANAALLHDGTVFIGTGAQRGVASAINSSLGFGTDPATVPVVWDPATNAFAVMADSKLPRMYHSALLRMPDGKIMTAGFEMGHEYRVQMFSPPYLLSGYPRPLITATPTLVAYNQTFAVGYSSDTTGTPVNITRVVFYRAGTVTHSTNHDQRQIVCSFSSSPGGGTLSVTAPPDGTIAPPGYYMLVLGSNQGVPSVASWVQLLPASGAIIPTPAPTPAPTPVPTPASTQTPTLVPTTAPTSTPTQAPTPTPSPASMSAPTAAVTVAPTPEPTPGATPPTQAPAPTAEPTFGPTALMLQTPTPATPTALPTQVPTEPTPVPSPLGAGFRFGPPAAGRTPTATATKTTTARQSTTKAKTVIKSTTQKKKTVTQQKTAKKTVKKTSSIKKKTVKRVKTTTRKSSKQRITHKKVKATKKTTRKSSKQRITHKKVKATKKTTRKSSKQRITHKKVKTTTRMLKTTHHTLRKGL